MEFFFIFLLVGLAWQYLEFLMLGEVRPNHVDDIIGFVLALSLSINSLFIKEFIRVLKKDK